jgi:hypothetical protein
VMTPAAKHDVADGADYKKVLKRHPDSVVQWLQNRDEVTEAMAGHWDTFSPASPMVRIKQVQQRRLCTGHSAAAS